MHHCPVEECGGHDEQHGVLLHLLGAIAAGQAAIVRELRHYRPDRSRIPAHVQDGINALDAQILAADRALSH